MWKTGPLEFEAGAEDFLVINCKAANVLLIRQQAATDRVMTEKDT